MKSIKQILLCSLIVYFVQFTSFNNANEDNFNAIPNKTTLADLNYDVLLQIVEHADIEDLLSIAEVNTNLFELVENVFRRKYSSRSFKYIIFDIPIFDLNIQDTEEYILIRRDDTFEKLSKHFRHLINKLEIEFTYDNINIDERVQNIGKFINYQYSDSLTEFSVYQAHKCFFKKMVRPFVKVAKVAMNGDLLNFDSSTLTMEELFPNLLNLRLSIIPNIDTNYTDRAFPHLEHLEMSIVPQSLQGITIDVQAFLIRNPQIKSLRLGTCSRPLLKFISDEMPNLASLALEYYNDHENYNDESPIIFTDLRNLTIYAGVDSVPRGIVCQNLIVFNTNAHPSTCNKWIDFVKRTTTLEMLNVWSSSISNDYLDQLATNDLSLTRVHLGLRMDISIENIINFIRNSGKLNEIRLTKFLPMDSSKLLAKDIRDQFEDQWQINEFDNEVCLIKRN